MRAIVNFEAHVDGAVLMGLTKGLNRTFGVSQFVQSRANCQGNAPKRSGIRWLAEPGRELLLLEQLFNLVRGKQARAGIFDTGKNRFFAEVKGKDDAFLSRDFLRIKRRSRCFLHSNCRKPAKPGKRSNVAVKFRRIEAIPAKQRKLHLDCRGRDVSQTQELNRVNDRNL